MILRADPWVFLILEQQDRMANQLRLPHNRSKTSTHPFEGHQIGVTYKKSHYTNKIKISGRFFDSIKVNS